MSARMRSSAVPPAGMEIVPADEFWRLVMSEKRDVMPWPERDYTSWAFNTYLRQPWGWCSEGFVPSGRPPVYAVLRSAMPGGAA